LKRGGKHINKDEREAIDRDLLLVKGNDASLQLTSRVDEFSIQDARSGSMAPAQAYSVTGGRLSLIVRAGQHHLVATASDGRSVTWDFSVEPGQTASHDFDFDAHPAAALAEEPKPAPQPVEQAPATNPSKPSTTLRTAGFVTAGVGLLVLGGAGVTGLMAKNKESSAKDQCGTDHVCDPSLQGEFDKANDLAHLSNYLLVGGGVVTVVGVTMIALGWHGSTANPSQSARGIRLLPLLSPSQGGLLAEGQF
jgi:hypothetical protein